MTLENNEVLVQQIDKLSALAEGGSSHVPRLDLAREYISVLSRTGRMRSFLFSAPEKKRGEAGHAARDSEEASAPSPSFCIPAATSAREHVAVNDALARVATKSLELAKALRGRSEISVDQFLAGIRSKHNVSLCASSPPPSGRPRQPLSATPFLATRTALADASCAPRLASSACSDEFDPEDPSCLNWAGVGKLASAYLRQLTISGIMCARARSPWPLPLLLQLRRPLLLTLSSPPAPSIQARPFVREAEAAAAAQGGAARQVRPRRGDPPGGGARRHSRAPCLYLLTGYTRSHSAPDLLRSCARLSPPQVDKNVNKDQQETDRNMNSMYKARRGHPHADRKRETRRERVRHWLC